MTSETILQEAIGLAREGRKTEARWLLEELLHADRANETAWLWYADCVETVEERVQALERCLRQNPNARRARAGLDLLRNPRPARAAAERPPVVYTRPVEPPVFLDTPAGPRAEAATAASAVFIEEPLARGEAKGQSAAQATAAVQAPAAMQAAAAVQAPPAFLAEAEPQADQPESVPAFDLTPEDEWLLSEGAGVFTVSPEALTPEELDEMAKRTEAFLAETRSEFQPLTAARARRRKQEEWRDLEHTTGSRAPSKRRKAAQAVEAGMTRAAYTTITALAVVILMVIALGAAIVLRGV